MYIGRNNYATHVILYIYCTEKNLCFFCCLYVTRYYIGFLISVNCTHIWGSEDNCCSVKPTDIQPWNINLYSKGLSHDFLVYCLGTARWVWAGTDNSVSCSTFVRIFRFSKIKFISLINWDFQKIHFQHLSIWTNQKTAKSFWLYYGMMKFSQLYSWNFYQTVRILEHSRNFAYKQVKFAEISPTCF